MKTFNMITALLFCGFYWISVSVSQTVEVYPGVEVTLHCANTSNSKMPTFWFRLVNTTKISCISVMYSGYGHAKNCEGFQSESFEMSSNISTIFLKIKHVDVSDSGLYCCGLYVNGRPVFTIINLKVKGYNESDDEDNNSKPQNKSNGIMELVCGLLGVLTVFFIMFIIVLMAKIKKLQKGNNQEKKPQCTEILDSADLKDAAHSLYSATVRSRRPGSDRNMQTHVIYAASR